MTVIAWVNNEHFTPWDMTVIAWVNNEHFTPWDMTVIAWVNNVDLDQPTLHIYAI
jgi:hypothetical protein